MNQSIDPRRTGNPIPADELRSAAQRDEHLQADPEMREGPATASRITMYGVAIVVLLGAVFYGLSRQTPDSTTAQSNPPAATSASSGSTVRDVTPNRDAGITTGTAPAQAQAPKSNPTGTEVDRSKGAVQ